jgi:hypothetical protein
MEEEKPSRQQEVVSRERFRTTIRSDSMRACRAVHTDVTSVKKCDPCAVHTQPSIVRTSGFVSSDSLSSQTLVALGSLPSHSGKTTHHPASRSPPGGTISRTIGRPARPRAGASVTTHSLLCRRRIHLNDEAKRFQHITNSGGRPCRSVSTCLTTARYISAARSKASQSHAALRTREPRASTMRADHP